MSDLEFVFTDQNDQKYSFDSVIVIDYTLVHLLGVSQDSRLPGGFKSVVKMKDKGSDGNCSATVFLFEIRGILEQSFRQRRSAKMSLRGAERRRNLSLSGTGDFHRITPSQWQVSSLCASRIPAIFSVEGYSLPPEGWSRRASIPTGVTANEVEFAL